MTRPHRAALVLLCLVAAALTGCGGPPITAQQIAAEANKRYTFPRDLGDGFRLDSIAADGNAIVSTVTIADPSVTSDPALVEMLRVAATSDICREIASARQAYIDAGLTVAKVYRDAKGAQIVRADVRPADCD